MDYLATAIGYFVIISSMLAVPALILCWGVYKFKKGNGMKWIKCIDKLPENEQAIDFYTKDGERIACGTFFDYKGTPKRFYDNIFNKIYELDKVSHWMAIQPPQEDNS